MSSYIQAIRELDAMEQEVKDGFELDFITGNIQRIEQYGDRTRFSDKQKAVIRRMAEAYLGNAYAAELMGQMRLI